MTRPTPYQGPGEVTGRPSPAPPTGRWSGPTRGRRWGGVLAGLALAALAVTVAVPLLADRDPAAASALGLSARDGVVVVSGRDFPEGTSAVVAVEFDGGSAAAWRSIDAGGRFEVAFRPPAGFTGEMRASAVAEGVRVEEAIRVPESPALPAVTTVDGAAVVPTTGAPAASTLEPASSVPVYQAPAQIPGDCSSDVTQALAAWLGSVPDGSTVLFTRDACYRVDGTVKLADRHGLVIDGNGATFRAQVPAPEYTNRAQWYVEYGSEITLRNMTLVGVNPRAEFDIRHEWDHNLFVRGTHTVTVENVHGRNSHGDFIAVAQGPDNATVPSDIAIRHVSGDTVGRMGVSCVACDGMSVEDSVFNDIAYHVFDLEIQGDDWPGRDVVYRGNTIGSHGWAAYSVGTPYETHRNDIAGLVISGNTVTMPGTGNNNCLPEISFRSSTFDVRGVTITDNTLVSHSDAVYVRRASDVVVEGNTAVLVQPACGDPVGIRTSDVERARIGSNNFSGYSTPERSE